METGKGKKPRLIATLGSSDDLKAFIKQGYWNQCEVIASGNTLTQILNGHVMSILVDNDPTFSQAKGLIGLEIEGGGVVEISHRSIWLKNL
ncbi:MAG: family 16 glycoside hydrolase [Candidatus Acidiferrales bacterium]